MYHSRGKAIERADGKIRVIAPDVRLGRDMIIPHPELVTLYGCTLGDNCKIASFVEIQRGVVSGRNLKVEAFAFISTGVTVEDGAFIGPHVRTIVILAPSMRLESFLLLARGRSPQPWSSAARASGANATIVCGVTIGEGALVGAGSIVTRNVPSHTLAVGNPARVVGPWPRL